MKRLAIVSSFNASCGIAAFSSTLQASIERLHGEVAVDVIELELALLQSTERRVRRLAERHIDGIAERLPGFDAVNLQLEPGLFGSLPNDVVGRVRRLLDANPRSSVTLHTPRLAPESNADQRALLRHLLGLRLRSAVRELQRDVPRRMLRKMSRKLVDMVVQRGQRLIVHTLRTQQQILTLWPQARVDAHPLKYIPDDFRPDPAVLAEVRQALGLRGDDVLIGMFGFVSAYKGHLDALDAMLELDPHCKLLIFGRQHPQTIRADGQRDPYLAQLQRRIVARRKLRHRVFFLGELDHASFLHVVAAVDACWLPYYENGQDGSGIASICLDLNPRVLCSASFAFDELLRLESHPNAIRFDIGNALELASKTEMALRRPPAALHIGSAYSLASQAEVYTRDLD